MQPWYFSLTFLSAMHQLKTEKCQSHISVSNYWNNQMFSFPILIYLEMSENDIYYNTWQIFYINAFYSVSYINMDTGYCINKLKHLFKLVLYYRMNSNQYLYQDPELQRNQKDRKPKEIFGDYLMLEATCCFLLRKKWQLIKLERY